MPRDDEFEQKSHYTYDEMMDRLKESRSGSRGSSGKKRRRRTEQPQASQRKRIQIFALIGGIVVLALIAVPIVLFMMSRGHYDTEAFRRSVSARVSTLTQKDADFGPFRMQGKSLFSPQLKLKDANKSGIVHEAMLKGLRADFNTSLHRGTEWPISKLAITSAQAILGLPSGEPAGSPSPSGEAPSQPIFGLSPNPSAIVIRDFYVRELDLAWGDPKAFQTIRQSKLQAQVIGNSVTWQIAEGTIGFGNLSRLSIGRLSGDLSDNKLTIARGTLGYSKSEKGTIKGTIDLTPGGQTQLDISLEKLDVARFLDLHFQLQKKNQSDLNVVRKDTGPWESRLRDGLLSFSGSYTSQLGKGSPQLQGEFILSNAILRDWHLFYAMSFAFEDSSLNNLKLEPVSGKFLLKDGKLSVTDLSTEMIGLMKLTGEFELVPNPESPEFSPTVSGKLQIELPEVYLNNFKGGYPEFFTQPNDGWGSVDITLSGELDEPRHNFLDMLPEDARSAIPSPPWGP